MLAVALQSFLYLLYRGEGGGSQCHCKQLMQAIMLAFKAKVLE